MISNSQSNETTDLAIIGSGMAGMSAALFAADRGMAATLIGNAGESAFASGLLDLLGVHPVESRKQWQDPWAGIEALARDLPDHPYARIKPGRIHTAMAQMLGFLNDSGLAYTTNGPLNAAVLTPAGTVKTTYGVPATMWPGVTALQKKRPCLIVDFNGMKEFSSRQIGSALADVWPNLRTARLTFPGTGNSGEVFTVRMAQALEVPDTREALADRVRPLVKDARTVGMPAIFGLYRTPQVFADLEALIGVPIFEIPTLSPSAPGIRLLETMKARLSATGVRAFLQNRVNTVTPLPDGSFRLDLGEGARQRILTARKVLLATGRFMGHGLCADRGRIREPLFDLPVHQPEERSQWHRKTPFDPRGHRINRAGLDIDDRFRPVDRAGRPVYPGLFAAGTILAHQDWMRMKCGSGLAIATAYAAVDAI